MDLEARWRGDEQTPSVARTLLDTPNSTIFSHDTRKLIGRMEQLEGSTASDYAGNLAELQDEREQFIFEVESLLNDVARAIDPTEETTSFDYVARNWNAVVSEVAAFSAERAGRGKRH